MKMNINWDKIQTVFIVIIVILLAIGAGEHGKKQNELLKQNSINK